MGIQNASWSFLRRPETWVIQNVTIEIYIYGLTVNAAIACRISRYSCTCNEIRATHLKGVFEHATTQTLQGYSKIAIIIETTAPERWDRIGKQATKSRYVGQCEVLRMGRILWQDFHLIRPLQCRFILQICHRSTSLITTQLNLPQAWAREINARVSYT